MSRFAAICVILIGGYLLLVPGSNFRAADPPAGGMAKVKLAWTFEEAYQELKLNRRNQYLQYVALQLATNENEKKQVVEFLDRALLGDRSMRRLRGISTNTNPFSLIDDSTALQENMQFDAMSGGAFTPRELLQKLAKNVNRFGGDDEAVPVKKEDKAEAQVPVAAKPPVAVSELTGISLKSAPWEKLLGDHKPKVSVLSRCVPHDNYFVEFRSISKLLEVVELADRWGSHFYEQAYHDAFRRDSVHRLQRQLGIAEEVQGRSFAQLPVREIALTGSDLLIRDGSDVTLLLLVEDAAALRTWMRESLATVRKGRKVVQEKTGTYQGIGYLEASSPDLSLSVVIAEPQPGLHLRSNSLAAMQRVIDTIVGKGLDGKPVASLGDSAEFQYLRNSMPLGAKEEDGLAYVSEAFVKKLLSPRLKLISARRVRCLNHLKLIQNGAALYQTQYGRKAKSLAELEAGNCVPGKFVEGLLKCADEGTYSLQPDGMTAICTKHGTSHFLCPCCESPLKEVSAAEAEEIKPHLVDQTPITDFLGPIALRMQATNEQFRLEAFLPQSPENRSFAMLSQFVGAADEPLDALPVPADNMLSFAVKVDKDKLLGMLPPDQKLWTFETPSKPHDTIIRKFLREGIGNQIGVYYSDSVPAFDVNVMQIIGENVRKAVNGFRGRSDDLTMTAFMASILNTSVHVAIPVKDAAVVDRFMAALDKPLSAEALRGGRIISDYEPQKSYFKLKHPKLTDFRGGSLTMGPMKLRLFWGRIGNVLYIGNREETLAEIADVVAKQATDIEAKRAPQKRTAAHALLRIQANHWQKVLPSIQFGWADNARHACFLNLSNSSYVARALQASGKRPTDADFNQQLQAYTDLLQGTHAYCPGGGHYRVSTDGFHCECSVHGQHTEPTQESAPRAESSSGKLLQELKGLTVAVTIEKPGIRAILTVERNPPKN